MNREENDILSLMVKDHCKIEKLLDDLKRHIDKDHPRIKESFYKFEWELEKHLFVEEKVIFTSYNPENVSEGYKMLPELTKQHNFIISKLNNWRKDIQNKRRIDGFNEFKRFMMKHRDFEEKEVYPRLDQSLDETQKKQIIERIDEIV